MTADVSFDDEDGLVRLPTWRDESGALRTPFGTVYEDSYGHSPTLGNLKTFGDPTREPGTEPVTPIPYGSTGIQPGGTSFEEADVDAQRALTAAVRKAQFDSKRKRFRRKRRAT